MKTVKRYKFLRKGMKSENGSQKWKLNKWEKTTGELDMCHNGFHCSVEPYDAFSYVQGEILAVVECRGENLKDNNKECWEEQRVIKTYKWTKKDSVALAIFAAESVLENFEKQYPNDNRPRLAIEAARKVLRKDTSANRSAAESAAESAARSAARSAGSAAESAAGSAAWSAWSAESAAWSAWSAESAARSAESAESAARSAAESADVKGKIQKWFRNHIKEMK